MKKQIKVFDYAKEILEATGKGILMTTKVGDKVNPMTIAWGTLGIEWNTPIYTVFVRESRFTKKLLEENLEFTVNIPLGDYDKNIATFCGRNSGLDVDKVKELNLTLVEPNKISVPAIKEFALTLECRVIYKQEQDSEAITKSNKERFYPNDDESSKQNNGDYHTAYYGEIVDAYIIES